MYYCEKCKVHVMGTHPYCPLCQGNLTGEPNGSGDVFPDIPFARKPYWLLLRILVLVTVFAVSVCAAVFFCLPGYRWASLSGAAGLASGWLTIGIAVKKRRDPVKAIFWQICMISFLAVAWEFGMGFSGWSLDFVLPVLYICTMAAIAVIAWFLYLQPQDYLLYLMLNILLGLVPLILLFFGMLRVIFPAVLCAVVSVVFLTALVLFEGTALKGELLRRLHL